MTQATYSNPPTPNTPAAPRPAASGNPFIKFVAPGLVVGFLLGLFAGVFAGPMLDGWMSRSSAPTPEQSRAAQPPAGARAPSTDDRLPPTPPTNADAPGASGAPSSGSPTPPADAPASGGEPAKPAPGR